ncbi:MAG: YraN family protein [Cocleimonas sp.]|nr:YraN family protein [Cocleimonas sp.]
MSNNTQKRALEGKIKGIDTEQLACDYLQSKGLQLLQRNFFSRYGEIDLIMRDKKTTVFIEVRYRKNRHYGGAAASVTPAKQQRIIKTALSYQQQNIMPDGMRFDVVAVEGTAPKIEWIQNAFAGF